MSIMNVEDINKVAAAASDKAERERRAKAARIQRDTTKRRRAAHAEDQQRRAEEQERLKEEIRGFYLVENIWATDEDFERAWKSDKERLIREQNSLLMNVQRM